MSQVLNDQIAERSLLGSLLMDSGAWDTVSDILFPDCFTDPEYRLLAECVWHQAKANRPLDPVSLGGAIRDLGKSEAIDDAWLWEIQAEGSTGDSMIRAWAERLRNLWAVRQRRAVAADMLNGDLIGTVEEALAKDSSRLLAIETGSTKRERHQRTILLERIEELEREWKAGPSDRHKKLVDTGIRELDGLIMGMQPGKPVLFCARPGMGKSAMAVSIIEHCGKVGVPVGVFWLEDFANSWATRTIARRTLIPGALLRHGSSLRKEHWTSLMSSIDASADWPIWIDDTHGLTARQIGQRMRRMSREHGIRVFLTDHLGEMRLEREERWGERHDLALGSAMRIYRDTAAELNAVPILLAQLGRINERDDEPKLSHIFGTGEAEQIVRTAVFLKRDGSKVIADVVKNTDGPTGSVELAWDPQVMAITSRPEPKVSALVKPKPISGSPEAWALADGVED